MPWPEIGVPTPMRRVAVVAPEHRVREVLVALAETGTVQIERATESAGGRAVEAYERARRRHPGAPSPSPTVVRQPLDPTTMEDRDLLAELAGEAELERMADAAVRRGSVAGWVGWSPAAALAQLAERLGVLGGAVVPLQAPRGLDPPTLVQGKGATRAFQPLVDTYATLGYRDLNPAALAGLAYVLIDGMMFGDVGHGLLLVALGLAVAAARPALLRPVRRLAPFVIGAGLASIGFGFAYGEFFGPTHVVPTVWLAPLDHPTTLLAVALAVGAALLAVSYALGTANRWREGGAVRALVATSGLAGTGLYVGLALVGLGWYRHAVGVEVVGGVLSTGGLVMGAVGLYFEAGGRASGAVQAGVEVFDAVVRIGTNTFSFARLAAFGLTHAALSGVVWEATSALWRRGAPWAPAAAVMFVVGNLFTFSLEGLVAGIQALRLEYYELFSRIFAVEGHRFEPWCLRVVSEPMEPKEAACSPG